MPQKKGRTNHKKTFALIGGLIIIMLLSVGCGPKNEVQPGPSPPSANAGEKQDYTAENEALRQLLPFKEGFRWVYSGFAEYSHQMELKSLNQGKEQTEYEIKGEIDDPSDGEAEGDFSLAITYLIKDGVLLQQKKAPRMMDTFPLIELLRAPLIEKNEWEQTVRDADGKEYVLVCTITEIKEDKKTYTIEYQDKNSDFYEKRQIRQGMGVIFFEKRIRLNNEPLEPGYYLYEEVSGYPQ